MSREIIQEVLQILVRLVFNGMLIIIYAMEFFMT